VVLQPLLAEGDIKVCLTWRDRPLDLDLIAVTPHTKICHARQREPGVAPHTGGTVSLDRDIRGGLGPETLSIRTLEHNNRMNLAQRGDKYQIHVLVHASSRDADLAGCGARIKVTSWEHVLFDEEAPEVGVGDFWSAFSLDLVSMSVRRIGRIVPSEPTFEVIPRGSSSGTAISSSGPELGAIGDLVKEPVPPAGSFRNARRGTPT